MVKKLIYGIAMVAGLASCNGDYDDWASPQQNAANEAAEKFELTVQPSVQRIDFAAENPETIALFSTNLAEGVASAEEFNVSFSTEGKEPVEFVVGTDGAMALKDIQSVIETLFGKAPIERTVDVKVSAMVAVNTADGIVKVSRTCDPFKLSAILDAPEIYPHMYLIGAPSEWNPTCTTLPFTHDDSKSVYDDPIFTITIPIADGDTWFAFADDKTVETGEWSNVFGAREGNGKNLIGETGYFTRRTDLSDDGSFMISVNGDAKYMKITLNVMDGTYLIEKISFADFIYEIGNNTGWSGVNPLSNNGEGLYTGYCWMDGEYKFKPNADDWVGDWEMVDDLGGNSFTLSDQGNSNFPSLNGFYEMKVDLATNTAQMTEVKSITCVGNHNGWTVNDAAQHMTYNQAEGCWELTTDLKDGFKFAMNDDWSVSWGGANGNPAAYDNLSQNGGKDLETPAGEGTYEIKLYLSCEGKNRVVLTKK